MDLSAFASPTALIATVAVGGILAVGATTFLPRVAMATVRWARSLIDGSGDFEDSYDDEANGTGRWTNDY